MWIFSFMMLFKTIFNNINIKTEKYFNDKTKYKIICICAKTDQSLDLFISIED